MPPMQTETSHRGTVWVVRVWHRQDGSHDGAVESKRMLVNYRQYGSFVSNTRMPVPP